MNNNVDKFEQDVLRHVYSRLWKVVAVIGLLIGAGIVFIANSAPDNPIKADMEIKVPGLVCSACAIGIKKNLKKEFNVKYVVFDINKQLVLIDFIEKDGRVIYLTNKKLLELIKKSGYEVTYIKRLHILSPNRYNKP